MRGDSFGEILVRAPLSGGGGSRGALQVYNKAPPTWFDRRCGGDGSGSSGDVGGIGGGNSFDGAYLRPCSWRERRREWRRERGRATKAWQLEEPKEKLEATTTVARRIVGDVTADTISPRGKCGEVKNPPLPKLWSLPHF